MNGYIVFVKGERFEVYADTLLNGLEAGIAAFKAKHPRAKVKPGDAYAHLAELNREPVIHRAVN